MTNLNRKSILKNIVGLKFGRLTVLEKFKKDSWVYCQCICECGNTKSIRGYSLLSGHARSCGCLKKDTASHTHITHNLSRHGLYKTWSNMKNRCYDERADSYKYYGGKGIVVCKEWFCIDIFIKWCKDNGWKKGLQIDRKDSGGNYEPSNCRIVTPTQNNRNKENNVIIEYSGKKLCISGWAEETRINKNTIYSRISRGWSIEDALTRPVFKKINSKK